MRNKATVSAPGKLMLFGEHAVVYGRPCLVTAVDQRIKASLEVIPDELVILEAPDVGIVNLERKLDNLSEDGVPRGAKFVLTAVHNFFAKYKVKSGLRIETKSDFSSEFGFGSSSAVTVAIIAGLSKIFGITMSRKEIFDLSYKTVLDIQGMGSGFDLAAAIWGGTLYFVGGGKVIQPLKIRSSIVVGYTGVKADTATLVKQVSDLREKEKKLVEPIFDLMEIIVKQAKKAFCSNDVLWLGRLADLNQGLLDALGVGSAELSNLIYASRQAGSFGAKLSGAGGGDCMISFVSEKNRKVIERYITRAGGKVLKVKTGAEGVKYESNR